MVSLVPSTTETVCRFGAGTRLVGCTRYCTQPAGLLGAVPRIGGTKNPDRDAVLALLPDLVLGNAEENRAEDLDWLGARVPVLVQTPRTVAEAAASLRELAARLDVTETAAASLEAIDRRIEALCSASRRDSGPRVYYAIWTKPWMTVGRDTFVRDVLRLCGGENVADGAAGRYPAMTPAQAVERGVELVLLASEPWSFDAQQRDRIAAQRLFGDAELLLCDGRDFSWHGVHMAGGLPRAAQLLRNRTTPRP